MDGNVNFEYLMVAPTIALNLGSQEKTKSLADCGHHNQHTMKAMAHYEDGTLSYVSFLPPPLIGVSYWPTDDLVVLEPMDTVTSQSQTP